MKLFDVRPLTVGDRSGWLSLWRGYLDFYQVEIPDAVTDLTWRRFFDPAEPLWAAVAVAAGRPVGLVHWLTHRSTWAETGYAYLEDLFVDPATRGGGVGAALIEHVRQAAQAGGCAKLYWLTRETNAVARSLYDKVAERTGFLQYAQRLER